MIFICERVLLSSNLLNTDSVSGWTKHCKHISQHSQSYVEKVVKKIMSVQCFRTIELHLGYRKSGEDENPPYPVVSGKASWR